jgi:hypothetical protein
MQPTLYAILPDHFTRTKSLAIKTKKKANSSKQTDGTP